jgi:hypothetical protein
VSPERVANLCIAQLSTDSARVRANPVAYTEGVLGLALAAVVMSLGGAHSARSAVVVPDVTHTGLAPAYAILRKEGLRVSVRARSAHGFLCQAGVSAQVPEPGTTMTRGEVVKLWPAFGMCGSPPPASAVTLPSVVGRRLSAAARLLTNESPVFWRAVLPALPAACGSQLFDNYRVVQQTPKAKAVVHPLLAVGDGTFRLTYVDLRVRVKPVRCVTRST